MANFAPDLSSGGSLPAINEDSLPILGQALNTLASATDSDGSITGYAIEANGANSITEGKWQYWLPT